jgi:hypothetical protein
VLEAASVLVLRSGRGRRFRFHPVDDVHRGLHAHRSRQEVTGSSVLFSQVDKMAEGGAAERPRGAGTRGARPRGAGPRGATACGAGFSRFRFFFFVRFQNHGGVSKVLRDDKSVGAVVRHERPLLLEGRAPSLEFRFGLGVEQEAPRSVVVVAVARSVGQQHGSASAQGTRGKVG